MRNYRIFKGDFIYVVHLIFLKGLDMGGQMSLDLMKMSLDFSGLGAVLFPVDSVALQDMERGVTRVCLARKNYEGPSLRLEPGEYGLIL